MTKKTDIMQCKKCLQFTENFCALWNVKTDPKGYCLSFGFNPNETLDSGNEFETGFNIDLHESEDLDGDNENNWTPTVDWNRK